MPSVSDSKFRRGELSALSGTQQKRIPNGPRSTDVIYETRAFKKDAFPDGCGILATNGKSLVAGEGGERFFRIYRTKLECL